MEAFARIGERRIQEAVEAGELDDLPGRGRPLRLDENARVPRELRAANRVLKNAGLVPQCLLLRADINDLEKRIVDLPRGPDRADACRRLALLRLRLEAERGPGARPQAVGPG